MALTNEELKQILEALKSEGFRFQLPNEEYENVKSFRLEEGELCNLPNLSQIRVGNGFDNIENLPFLNYSEIPLASEDLPAVQADKIWQNIKAKTSIYQLWQGLMPQEILNCFIELKPDNFSLLEGEELPIESPARSFWENSPNGEGAFFRNYHFNNTDNANNDVDLQREIGSFQMDAMQPIQGNIYNSTANLREGNMILFENANGAFSLSDGNKWGFSKTLLAQTWGKGGIVNFDSSRVTRTGKETRPKNICVISVWRTY